MVEDKLRGTGQVEGVQKAPFADLYEVVVRAPDGLAIYYVDSAATVIIAGKVFDAKSGRNLTEERERKLTAINWESLPLQWAITQVRGTGRRKIAILSDPNCPYCKRLEEDLAKLDDITIHILPYWDEQSSQTPLEYVKDKIGQLRKAYPNKNIVVTEVGWPSNGAERRSPATGFIKQATPAEQARNVRDMVAWLKAQNIQYFVVEAIDQPWKSYDLEGKAGGYWGLWNADRQQKFEWTGPIETFPEAGWDKVMDTNVKAVFFLTQALLPQLRAAAAGPSPARVINIGSIDGIKAASFETYDGSPRRNWPLSPDSDVLNRSAYLLRFCQSVMSGCSSASHGGTYQPMMPSLPVGPSSTAMF